MEGKYGRLRQVSVCAEGGETKIVDVYAPWEDDEPLFLIRGQDKLALDTLFAYACLARAHHCTSVAIAVEHQIKTTREWQRQHPERMKLPD